MIISIAINWLVGVTMSTAPNRRIELIVLSTGVGIDLAILGWYKYGNFIAENMNAVIGHFYPWTLSAPSVTLPLGISFFTFHAISYIVDIYRRQAAALRNPLDMGLYISFFPQLVAGPIIRYHDIAEQITKRTNTLARFASGIERFCYGLAKKVLIANTLGQVADEAFGIPASFLSFQAAWLGILCYTLQIYFDFSGYSDMAIGLGRMFGFELTENFNYPYIARSVREFWRRWHLSLSTWFRDYLYIPLGGNRGTTWKIYFNLFAVFLLCGLWHGASWNFVFWGGFHGILLVLERGKFGAIIDACPGFIASAYTIFTVMVGWVFFRADTLADALHYLSAMLGMSKGEFPGTLDILLNARTYFTLASGIVLSTPLFTFLSGDWRVRRFPAHAAEPTLPNSFGLTLEGAFSVTTVAFVRSFVTLLALLLSMIVLAASTYNPFIYFRF
ncbi:MAG: MBOAT family O-acyltransferase [Methylococcales bacterium]